MVGGCGPQTKSHELCCCASSRLFTLFCTDLNLTTQIHTIIPRKEQCKSNANAGRNNSDNSGIFINTEDILLLTSLVFYKDHRERRPWSSDSGTVMKSPYSRSLDLRTSQRNRGHLRFTSSIVVVLLFQFSFFVFFVNPRLKCQKTLHSALQYTQGHRDGIVSLSLLMCPLKQ